MKIPFRRPKSQDDDVRWLEPTQLRQPRRRGLPLALIAFVLLAASAAVIGYVVLSGPKPSGAPNGKVATTTQPAPEPVSPGPTPRGAPPPLQPAPSQPTPAPPITPQPSQEAAQAPPTETIPPPVAEAPPTVTPPADEPAAAAPSPSVAGAFPAARDEATDDPDAPNFAAYLNEAAPDEAGARTLVVEAQRRYAGALEGGRLSYRRVRAGDGYVWRLRLSGLTRARAQETCQALTSLGAACEIGPR